jgi:ethanolamine kinase
VVPKDAAIAFCHNDLLAANILVADNDNDDDRSVQLIDFEYGSINYVAFDIANHFNEYAGGTDDGVPQYDRLPSEAQQLAFLTEYGKACPSAGNLLEEVRAFMLVSHLYWGLWAVHQAATRGCGDFDYVLYAQNRIAQYRRSKSEPEQMPNIQNGGDV